MNEKRKIIVLVGPPSVGKSTWIKNNIPNAYIISRDDLVDQKASELSSKYKTNWTYDDLFVAPDKNAKIGDIHEKYGTVISYKGRLVFDKIAKANEEIEQKRLNRIKEAHPSGQDIVVDMTNMTAFSRKNALQAISGNEDEYLKIAVDFKFKGSEELIKRVAAKRSEESKIPTKEKPEGGSKTIPDVAFDRMFLSYEPPTESEGFDIIIPEDTISDLEKSLSLKNNLNEIRKIVRNIIKEFF